MQKSFDRARRFAYSAANSSREPYLRLSVCISCSIAEDERLSAHSLFGYRYSPERFANHEDSNFSKGDIDENKNQNPFSNRVVARAVGGADSHEGSIRAREQPRARCIYGRIPSHLLHFFSGDVCVPRLGASNDRHEDKHGKPVVRMDSDLKYYSDAEHRQETYLVDHSVSHPARERRHLRHTLDGSRRGARQTQLVGNFDNRASGKPYCAGLLGLVGLVCRVFEARISGQARSIWLPFRLEK